MRSRALVGTQLHWRRRRRWKGWSLTGRLLCDSVYAPFRSELERGEHLALPARGPSLASDPVRKV